MKKLLQKTKRYFIATAIAERKTWRISDEELSNYFFKWRGALTALNYLQIHCGVPVSVDAYGRLHLHDGWHEYKEERDYLKRITYVTLTKYKKVLRWKKQK